MKVILASNSPRRKELLTQAGIDFEIISENIEEKSLKNKPDEIVVDLSCQKAMAVAAKNPKRIVIAADTVVAYHDKVLGKPKDENDAMEMLLMLSGKTHQVYTGVTIVNEFGEVNSFFECTEVTMYDNSKALINEYISTKEPMDKAGAYGIQGKGAILVKEIKGDYNNVVGLPLAEVYRRLYEI